MPSWGCVCSDGHETFSDYPNRDRFEKSLKRKILMCGVETCGKPVIREALSAPGVNSGVSRNMNGTNYSHVGDRFYELGLKILRGEIPNRPMMGSASDKQLKELHEAGLNVAKIRVTRLIGVTPKQSRKSKNLN